MKLRSQTFVQEMHCCGVADAEATLTIDINDGGGGEYVVMHASHWSFENENEVDLLAATLKSMIVSRTK
jgi:hypothetical protein